MFGSEVGVKPAGTIDVQTISGLRLVKKAKGNRLAFIVKFCGIEAWREAPPFSC